MKYSEENLVKGIKKGSDEIFRKLFDLYYYKLFCIARQYVQDDFIADTLVGDLFFHLWESRQSFHVTTSLNAYLIRSIRNLSLNYLQKNYVTKEINIQSVSQIFLTEEYPLGILLEKELSDKLYTEINNLPPATREVFLLSRMEELKHNEIAEKLNISVNTVKYHIKQALFILRERLKDYFTIFITAIFTALNYLI